MRRQAPTSLRFFFAGHGLEVNGANYLIPVDSKLRTDRTLTFEAVSLSDVMVALDDVKGVRIVLLDACRNNPFIASMKRGTSTRSIGRGLARIEPANGTVISFAAKAGQIAADGKGPNSPFTAALLQNLSTPGLDIGILFRKVRDSVYKATSGAQEPFVSASLTGKQTYLVPPKFIQPRPGVAGNDETKQSVAAAALTTNRQIELAVWNAIKTANEPNLLKDYLNRYPLGEFVLIAKQKLKRLAGLGNNTVELESPPDDRDRRALIRDVQTALSDAGCNPGSIDGFWGRKGKRALRAFNRATGNRLSVEAPTETTLSALRRHQDRACAEPARVERASKPSKKAKKDARKKNQKKKASRESRRKRKLEAKTKSRGKTTKRNAKQRTKRKAKQRTKRKVATSKSSGGSQRAGCRRVVRRVCAGLFGSGPRIGKCLAEGNSRCRRSYP